MTRKKISRPPNQKGLTSEALNDIRRMIFSNELKPGQKIPYRRMADSSNMSLTPVVQALKHMEFMGLVRHEQNKGFFVETVKPEEIDEAYKLRYVLEPVMLATTIPILDKKGEKKIDAALNEYLNAGKNGSLKLKLVTDIQFHMTIAELSKQNLSILMLRHLFDFLYLRFDQELIFSRPSDDSAKDNTAIFRAIQRREVEVATKLLQDHILTIHKNAMEGIEHRLSNFEKIVF